MEPGQNWYLALGHLADSEDNQIILVEEKSGLYSESGSRKDWGEVIFDGSACNVQAKVPSDANGFTGKFVMVFVDDDPLAPKESIPVSIQIKVQWPEVVIKKVVLPQIDPR